MEILLSPQVREDERVIYEFDGDTIKASYKGKTDTFDFSGFPDGELQIQDSDGNWRIETGLDYQPIRGARKEDGVLYVRLVNFIAPDAPESERFPDWIDASEYVAPADPADPAPPREGRPRREDIVNGAYSSSETELTQDQTKEVAYGGYNKPMGNPGKDQQAARRTKTT